MGLKDSKLLFLGLCTCIRYLNYLVGLEGLMYLMYHMYLIYLIYLIVLKGLMYLVYHMYLIYLMYHLKPLKKSLKTVKKWYFSSCTICTFDTSSTLCTSYTLCTLYVPCVTVPKKCFWRDFPPIPPIFRKNGF